MSGFIEIPAPTLVHEVVWHLLAGRVHFQMEGDAVRSGFDKRLKVFFGSESIKWQSRYFSVNPLIVLNDAVRTKFWHKVAIHYIEVVELDTGRFGSWQSRRQVSEICAQNRWCYNWHGLNFAPSPG